MPAVILPELGTAAAWRDAARGLLAADTLPESVIWSLGVGPQDLFAEAAPLPPRALTQSVATVPRGFLTLADNVVWHRDPQRFARLYAFLWRLRAREAAMSDRGDPALARLRAMEKEVSRDKHKMKAFLRFREIGNPADVRRSFAAWFEPSHYITEPLAPFFTDRFGDMDWLIVTPDCSATFQNRKLSFGPGMARPDLPEDGAEQLWTTYFRNIFNPARLKVKAMQAEMPKKYWKNMPEAATIPDLIAHARERAEQMQRAAPTLPPLRADRIKASLPHRPEVTMPQDAIPDTFDALRRAEAACTRCPLYANATQVVPGEGPADAELMVVGEQPGDQEDLQGRPFVGPAGQLFDRVAQEAGLDRSKAYVTNAVKHFKFTPRGKRRIHARPDAGEVRACQWWLDAERELVKPRLILAMGATAAAAVTGTGKDITKRRGTLEQTADGTPVFLTVHPSYLLRLPDAEARARETARFHDDLAAVARHLDRLRAA